MEYKSYLSYYDVYGRNESFANSVFKIKLIFSMYSRELILSFLSYVAKEMGVVPTPASLMQLQNNLGIKIKGIVIHTRAVLALFQIFFESIKFNDNNKEQSLRDDEVTILFLYANQILNKTDFEKGEKGPAEINIQLLMSMMKLYVGTINAFEINLMEEYFLLFYEKLAISSNVGKYNKILLKHTNMDISNFIDVLKQIKYNKKLNSPFELFDKFGVLNYENIYEEWNSRIPAIPVPSEYRFFEQYPLIKKEQEYYGVSPLIMFLALIRKPYHVLSNDVDSKDLFRAFWGSFIVEPIIKQYIIEIFSSENNRIIDMNFQKILGVEPCDLVIVKDDDIFAFEIKSGYMALEDRYSLSSEKFKIEFEKKYVYNSSNKHQLINQLDIFDKKYVKIAKLLELDPNKKYKIFSCLIVFDEALSMLGFKRYLRDIFNKTIEPKFYEYKKFLPFPYSNLMTFSELLSFRNRVKDVDKRGTLVKASFGYEDSIHEFFDDIKNEKVRVDGIIPTDIS